MISVTCDRCSVVFEREESVVKKLRKRGCAHAFCSRTCAAISHLRAAHSSYRHVAKRPTPIIQLEPAAAGYLAGLIDGEGSFSLYPTRNKASLNVSLTISNTDLRLLDWCKNVTGVGSNIVQKQREGNRRMQYLWAVNARNDLRVLLPQVIPYLLGKAEQAKVVLSYCEQRASKAEIDIESFIGVVSKLNKRL